VQLPVPVLVLVLVRVLVLVPAMAYRMAQPQRLELVHAWALSWQRAAALAVSAPAKH
jgi:hypothetical protein